MRLLRVIVFGVYLLVLAVIDVRKRKFPLWVLLLGITAVVFLGVLQEGKGYFLNHDLWFVVISSIFFLGISWLTHEKFGFADSIMILGIFLTVGYEKGMFCVTAAFWLAGAVSVVLLIRKKAGKRTALPFLPYLFAGYMAGVISSI